MLGTENLLIKTMKHETETYLKSIKSSLSSLKKETIFEEKSGAYVKEIDPRSEALAELLSPEFNDHFKAQAKRDYAPYFNQLGRSIIKLDRWGGEVAVFSYGDPIYNIATYFNAIHADDKGYIFVGDEKNNIYKYSTSGKRFWIKQATTDSETEVERIMDDPTDNKRIIVACGKKLAFIRKSDGEREKEVTLPFYPQWLHSVGKDLYVAGFASAVTKDYDFYKYDLSTDPNMTKPVWKTFIDSPRSIHYDGFGGVFVAFGSYYNSFNTSELLKKLDAATGETIATYNIKNTVFSVISVGWKDIWVGDKNGTIYKLQQI